MALLGSVTVIMTGNQLPLFHYSRKMAASKGDESKKGEENKHSHGKP